MAVQTNVLQQLAGLVSGEDLGVDMEIKKLYGQDSQSPFETQSVDVSFSRDDNIVLLDDPATIVVEQGDQVDRLVMANAGEDALDVRTIPAVIPSGDTVAIQIKVTYWEINPSSTSSVSN